MSIPEGKQKDIDMMERAFDNFSKLARKKFMAGIEEHNADGSKGMHKMTRSQKFQAMKEEIIDLWFYVISAEEADENNN